MKIFLSYGHDSNAPLIEKIKDYLLKDEEGNLKDEVDTSEIKAPSHKHCVMLSASRELMTFLKGCGFMTNSTINRI